MLCTWKTGRLKLRVLEKQRRSENLNSHEDIQHSWIFNEYSRNWCFPLASETVKLKRAFASPTLRLKDPFYQPGCSASWTGGDCATVFKSSYGHILSHWGIVPKGSLLDLSLPILGLLLYGSYLCLGIKIKNEYIVFPRKSSFSTDSSIHFCALKALDSFQVCFNACIVWCLVHGLSL